MLFIPSFQLLVPTKRELWRPSAKSPIQVVDGFLWRPDLEDFVDVRGAEYHEIVAMLRATQLTGFGGDGTNFTAITNTYTSGTAATENIPSGAQNCSITIWGGGGAGGRQSGTGRAAGASGGAKCTKAVSVVGGGSFTRTCGAAVVGRGTNGVGSNGNASTVSGTVSGGVVSMSAAGGNGGGSNASGTANGGAAATAAGGDTNDNSTAASNAVGAGTSTAGTAGAGTGGGAGGTSGGSDDGTAPGGAGGGCVDGASGGGARGQNAFAYT